MQISAITQQVRDKNRVNVSVDGSYRFSLDITQLVDLGLKVGNTYSEDELEQLIAESTFGKLYMRALEFVLMRPHSAREIQQYLWKKTRDRRLPEGGLAPGVPQVIADRVFERLLHKGYVDDESFARHWVENRRQRSGISQRRLEQELRQKGVDTGIIHRLLGNTLRSDQDELRKVIAKRARRYSDPLKFRQYLQRQGFSYDDIAAELAEDDS